MMVDEQTFVREAQAMERTLYRISRSYLPRWEDCADAVQEALGKAWAKRRQADPGYFRAWLTRIVINECHNCYRRQKRIVYAEQAEAGQNPAFDDAIALRQSLSTLPEKLRLPLLLHYLEGFSLKEVARILRLPIGTVKSRLHQARKALKLELEQEDKNARSF